MSSVEVSEEERIFYATWGSPLEVVFKIGIEFFKEKTGTKALNLTYHDKLNLIALIKQSLHGPYNDSKGPQSGLFDIVGNDRKNAWNNLGQMPKDMAMRCFVDSLTTFCPLFVAHVTAHRVENEEEERKKLRETESLNEQMRQQKLNEEFMKQDSQERQTMQEAMIRNALNQQTINQFRGYAQIQYPNQFELQEQLIAHLQEEHYQQYMLQILQRQQIVYNIDPQKQHLNNNQENLETKQNLSNGAQCNGEQKDNIQPLIVENTKVNNNDVPISSFQQPGNVNETCVSDAAGGGNKPPQNSGQEQVYEESVLQYYRMKIQQQQLQQQNIEHRSQQHQQLQQKQSQDSMLQPQLQQQLLQMPNSVAQLIPQINLGQQQLQPANFDQQQTNTSYYTSQQHVFQPNIAENDNPPSYTMFNNTQAIYNQLNTSHILEDKNKKDTKDVTPNGTNLPTQISNRLPVTFESTSNDATKNITTNVVDISYNLMTTLPSNVTSNISNGHLSSAANTMTSAGNISRIEGAEKQGMGNGKCGHGINILDNSTFQEATIWTRKDKKEKSTD